MKRQSDAKLAKEHYETNITKILKLSPTYFVSNIRHQHRCHPYFKNRISDWDTNTTTYMDTVVDEENKILFCGVPKAATTVLKRMFLKMEFPRFKNVELDDIRAGKDGKLSNTHGQDLRSLEDYSLEKRKQILQSYYKVSIQIIHRNLNIFSVFNCPATIRAIIGSLQR